MAIERQYGKIIFTCDQENSARCEEQLETDERNWEAAKARFDQAGWQSIPLTGGGGFIHCCPRCTTPR